MQAKLRILLISPYLPAIDSSACSRNIYEYIRLLRQRKHEVYLLSFCSEEDKKRIGAVRPHCTQVHLESIVNYLHYPLKSTRLTDKIKFLCRQNKIDILHCESAYMSRYLPENTNIPLVLTEHEVLSASFYERLKIENNFIKKVILFIRARKKQIEERRWYRRFNKIIVFSENDKDIISKAYHIKNIGVIPLAINLKDYPLQPKKEKTSDIVFVGNFSHPPNVDAALYLYKYILLLIKKRLPDISLMLAGANPPASIRRLSQLDRNIAVTGYTEDILGSYAKAKIFVAPIRYGTGMRFKVLEAMTMGIPVVSTSIGARGILKENIEIADTPDIFADTVIELLGDRERCKLLTENARLTIEKYYNWDFLLDRYENIYYDLLR